MSPSWRLTAFAVLYLMATCVGSASGDSLERPQHHELSLKEGLDRFSPSEESRRDEVDQHQSQHRELFTVWNLLFMCTFALSRIVLVPLAAFLDLSYSPVVFFDLHCFP